MFAGRLTSAGFCDKIERCESSLKKAKFAVGHSRKMLIFSVFSGYDRNGLVSISRRNG